MKTTLFALAAAATVVAGLSVPVAAENAVRAIDLFRFDSASGYAPGAGVITDRHGNVFGTTDGGGTGPCDAGAGCGTVYELSPAGGGSWTLNVLYNFQGGQDGSFPYAMLTLGPNGSIYGYTSGGTSGTVWQLSPPAGGSGAWTFQILYIFSGGKDGNLLNVSAPLVHHGQALYGIESGGSNACGQFGCGGVFRLTPPKSGSGSWHHKTLYSFTGSGSDGFPISITGFDGQDALFVATSENNGAVAEFTPAGSGAWNETVLSTFNGGSDGYNPASLVLTATNTLYGIAGANRGGLAFQLSNDGSGWTRTNIAAIDHNGYGPTSLAAGENGTLIGTIEGDVDFFAGNVFQLTPPGNGGAWTYTQLWNFNRGPDRNPNNVVTGRGGHLFGVLNGGDSSVGSLFELR